MSEIKRVLSLVIRGPFWVFVQKGLLVQYVLGDATGHIVN